MKRRTFMERLGKGSATFLLPPLFSRCNYTTKQPPHILWIVSEDNSPFLGCYGDDLAVTPNLDKLASEGFLFTHAYANTPVCAPARNTIITGVYACSNGHQHMRSSYPLSETVRMFPRFLREVGYYCTNNAKEDYNTIKPPEVWDESSRNAHYRNRAEGQPFFHIKNIGISHESSIHEYIPKDELRHRPEKMVLPPYHPDTEEMRHDWAQYYDKITDMDSEVGKVLKQLEDEGLADDTIVFYYSDHGGVLGRSKRFVYESGTHVPFLIRIPEKFKYLYPGERPGSRVNRLISFVDLAATMLSITGIPIPDYMQGNAFLGRQKTEDPDYAYMFRGRMDEWYDMCRSVRAHKFRYIKNYMPHRIYAQRVAYLWRAPSMQSWEKAYRLGECNKIQSVFWNTKPHEELYDTENDPWEINNLAGDPAYNKVLDRMRNANKAWMARISDTGFIPEADQIRRSGEVSMYDYIRSADVPLSEMIRAGETASQGRAGNIDILIDYLVHKDSAIRYWGAMGLLILADRSAPAKETLLEVLDDESPDVVVAAAEILYILGEKEVATNALLDVLEYPEDKAVCHALNTIVYLGEAGSSVRNAITRLSTKKQYSYSKRIVDWLIEKWN
ncbi:sulfatase-like hydrolase/transferase [Acidobacteriota bacterium]